MTTASLTETLARYEALFGVNDSTRAFRVFFERCPQPTSRQSLMGHVTGSALVWHEPSRSVLRVYHAKLKCWVFTAGGHVEDGEEPWQTSRRELAEETGIEACEPFYRTADAPLPLAMDVHAIPASPAKNEPSHWHYDMVYLYRVQERPEIKADPKEIAAFHWVDVAEVTTADAPIDLARQMELFLRA